MPRRMARAFAIANSKDDRGSLTPQSDIGQINEPYVHRLQLSSKQEIGSLLSRSPARPGAGSPTPVRGIDLQRWTTSSKSWSVGSPLMSGRRECLWLLRYSAHGDVYASAW